MSREQGIKAIIALQGMAGIVESQESAGAGWDRLSEDQQAYTMQVYEMFFGD